MTRGDVESDLYHEGISLVSEYQTRWKPLPGPVSKRLIEMEISNKSNSKPPTNPSEILARNVEPIISIMNRIETILVSFPTSMADPSNDFK